MSNNKPYTVPTSGTYTFSGTGNTSSTTVYIHGTIGGSGGSGGSISGSSVADYHVNDISGWANTETIKWGPFTMYKHPYLQKCSMCKKEPIQVAMSYTPYKDTRYICNTCSQDAFDKMFGIDNSTEKVLFGK